MNKKELTSYTNSTASQIIALVTKALDDVDAYHRDAFRCGFPEAVPLALDNARFRWESLRGRIGRELNEYHEKRKVP